MRSRLFVRAAFTSAAALVYAACTYDFTVGDGAPADEGGVTDRRAPDDGGGEPMNDGGSPGSDSGVDPGVDAAPVSLLCVSGHCQCDAGTSCEVICANPDECDVTCAESSTCIVACQNTAICTQTCSPGATCGIACPSGGCDITCESAHCTGNCTGGACTTHCNGSSVCNVQCPDNTCSCIGAGCVK